MMPALNRGTTASALAAAALLAPIALFAVLYAAPERDPVIMRTTLHFWAVGATAIAAGAACALVVASGRTLRETRLLFLALAFMAIGGVFSVHGLLTPGVVVHRFHTPLAVSSWVSVLLGGTFAALSVVAMPAWAERALRRAGTAIFAWATLGIGAYIVLAFAQPHWLDWAPTDERRIQYLIGGVAFYTYLFAAWRYFQAWQYAQLPAQAAMAASMLLLTQVPPILLWGTLWHLSWWLYHAIYGAAFAVLFAGWGVEARRAGSLRAIADALAMRDALSQLDRGRDAHVLELVDAIEAKDVATLGHVRRVGAYAITIGKALGLGRQDLEQLALAAEMHDVGKIGVPDAILTKPGKLTQDEFAEMQRHTGRGYDIARRVRTLRDLAPVIRAHHERLDGSGYPDALRGDAIPLLARIIAVADSYDAMTSERAYRGAMSHDAAVAELLRVRGTELDAGCVDAFLSSFAEAVAA